jgi:hypothetical protein
MLSAQEYREQIERQVDDLEPVLERKDRELLLNTITGYGQARYNDGHTDSRALDDPEASSLLTPRDMLLARQVLGRMPYLPLVPNHTLYEGATVRELVRILDGLAEVLTRYGEQATQTESELSELRSDVAAARRVLGIPAALTRPHEGDDRP